jgi:hypothetical protein
VASYDSADLLARLRTQLRRPSTDETLTDAQGYQALTDAQNAIYEDVFTRSPDSMTGALVALTSLDGGYTFPFGTDANGDAIEPLGHVGIYTSPAAVADCAWQVNVDYLNEGTRIRIPNGRTYSGTLYWRGVLPPAAISATSPPSLTPASARVLIVYWAAAEYAGWGDLKDATSYRNKYTEGLGRLLLRLKTQFRLGPSYTPLLSFGGGGNGGSGGLPFPNLPWVNVKDAPYNATGDGLTDDTAAIQAAMTAAAGKKLIFDDGASYFVSAPLVLPSNVDVDFNGATFASQRSDGLIRIRLTTGFFSNVGNSGVTFRNGVIDLGQTYLPTLTLADYNSGNVFNVGIYCNGAADIRTVGMVYRNLYTRAFFSLNGSGYHDLLRTASSSPVQLQGYMAEHICVATFGGDLTIDKLRVNNTACAPSVGTCAVLLSGTTGTISCSSVYANWSGRDLTSGHQLQTIAMYGNHAEASFTNCRSYNTLFGFMRIAESTQVEVSDFRVSYAPTADPSQQAFSIESTGINIIAGTGTVTIAGGAGAATFTTSQAGIITNGSIVSVAGVPYLVSAFNGTTTCTLSGGPVTSVCPNQVAAGFFVSLGGVQCGTSDIHVHHGTVKESYSSARIGMALTSTDYAAPLVNIRAHDIDFVNIKNAVEVGGPYQTITLRRLHMRGLYAGYISYNETLGGAITATHGVTAANSVCTGLKISDCDWDTPVSGGNIPINMSFGTYAGTIGTVEFGRNKLKGSGTTQAIVYRGIAGQGRLIIRGCEMDNYTIALDVANVSELTVEQNRPRNITTFYSPAGTIGTAIVRNNPGYNPVGPSAVTVAASPMTYTAGASPEVLYVKGGTVTTITKGGITLAAVTDQAISLAPNQACVITYTVAPTMAKDVL